MFLIATPIYIYIARMLLYCSCIDYHFGISSLFNHGRWIIYYMTVDSFPIYPTIWEKHRRGGLIYSRWKVLLDRHFLGTQATSRGGLGQGIHRVSLFFVAAKVRIRLSSIYPDAHLEWCIRVHNRYYEPDDRSLTMESLESAEILRSDTPKGSNSVTR